MLEAAADFDENIFEKIIMEDYDSITMDELKAAIRKGTIEMKLNPVLCGSSYKNTGVQLMLDAVVDFLPAPTDVASIEGINPKTDNPNFVTRAKKNRSAHLYSRFSQMSLSENSPSSASIREH